MNRACLALSVLFATMAASFMAVGTAKSQTEIEAGLASQDEFACPLSHENLNQCPWGHYGENFYGPSVCNIETATNEEISEGIDDVALKTFQDEDPSGLIAPLDLECHWVCDRYSFKFPPTNEIELNKDAAAADVVVEETKVAAFEEEPPVPQEAPANTADEAATAAADSIEEEAYSYDEYPEYDWDYEKAYGNEFEYESETAPAPPETVVDTDIAATESIETDVATTEEDYDYGYGYEQDYGYDTEAEYGDELEADNSYEDEYGYDYDAEYSKITEANEAATQDSQDVDYDAELDRLFETEETVEVEASTEATIETETETESEYDSEYDYEAEYDYDSSYDYDTEYDYDYDAQVEAQEETIETDDTSYDSEYEYDSEYDYEAEYGYDAEIEAQNKVEAIDVETDVVPTEETETETIDDTQYDDLYYYGDEYYEYGDEYFGDDETVEPVAEEKAKTHFWVDNASDYGDNAADCFGADCADTKKPAVEIETEQEPHTEYDWESEYLWQYEAIENDTTGELQVIEAAPTTKWTHMLLAAPRALIHTVEHANVVAEQTLCNGEFRKQVEQASITINKLEASARLAERKERKRQRQTKSSQQRIWKTLAQLPTSNPYSVAAISVARAANNAVSTAVMNRLETALISESSLLVR